MTAFSKLRRLSGIFMECAKQASGLVRDGTLSQALDKVTFSTQQFVQLWKHATPTARKSFEEAADLKGEERQIRIRAEVAHDFHDAVVKAMNTAQFVAGFEPSKVPDDWKPVIVQDALGLPQLLAEIVSNYRSILGPDNEAVNAVLKRYETELIPALPAVGEAVAAEMGFTGEQVEAMKAGAYRHITQGTEHIGRLPADFKI